MQKGELEERVVRTVLLLCAFVSVATSIAIVVVLVSQAWEFFSRVGFAPFLFDTTWTPLFAEKRFGIWPLIAGTALTSGVALLVAVPLGLMIAVFLSEFASPGLRRWVKPILEVLAGIPTIVYGYFALLFVTPLLQQVIPGLPTFNALSAGIVMGFMILPMVASLSEDALYTLPDSLREASDALGAQKMQTVFRVLVPAAWGGITAAGILAVSRAVGETMIVTIAAGQQPQFTLSPLEPVATMTAYIVQVSLGDTPHGSLEYHTIFAVGATLFLITLVVNSLSLWLRERAQREYQ